MRLLSGLAALVILASPGLVAGSSFAIDPVRVTLTQGAATGLVTVKNQSSGMLRLQLTGFAWAESPEGQMQLSETADLVFFPSMLSIPAGSSGKVRVGTHLPPPAPGQMERTYRLFIEELPGPGKTNKGPMQIKVLLRMGVPIFVAPASPRPEPSIDGITVGGGKLRVRVRNKGTAHFRLATIRLHGEDEAHNTLLDLQMPGWYVLAGSERVFEADLPPGVCGKLALVTAEAETEATTVTASVNEIASKCTDE